MLTPFPHVMHSPTDICVGALEGIVAGVLAFLLVRQILAAIRRGPAEPLAKVSQHVEGSKALTAVAK